MGVSAGPPLRPTRTVRTHHLHPTPAPRGKGGSSGGKARDTSKPKSWALPQTRERLGHKVITGRNLWALISRALPESAGGGPRWPQSYNMLQRSHRRLT
eukprot:1204782-Pyramimonas_sp.AAC.1